MSELKQSFKKAIQTFTHASDLAVPLYEDAYLIAEDISDEIAAHRSLYQQDYEAQQLIESEIEGAVAFFSKIPAAFLMIQLSLFEDCLLEICEAAAQARNFPFRMEEEATGFTAELAKRFIEHELGVVLPDPWPVWEKVQEFQRLRDQVVKQGSFGEGSANISDTLLVQVNETAVLFFEELQSHLLSNSDAG
jgi:hypothetical protein